MIHTGSGFFSNLSDHRNKKQISKTFLYSLAVLLLTNSYFTRTHYFFVLIIIQILLRIFLVQRYVEHIKNLEFLSFFHFSFFTAFYIYSKARITAYVCSTLHRVIKHNELSYQKCMFPSLIQFIKPLFLVVFC